MPFDVPDEITALRKAAAGISDERLTLVGRGDRRERVGFDRLDRDLATQIIGIRDRIDPCDATAEVPLVLLPVRVEAKLAADGTTLRVRMTPDEIHVDALLRALTDAERDAGQAYWRLLWADADAAAAWTALVAVAGARRAGWVAEATRPANAADKGAADPVFPDDPGDIALGTVARCLPDQFVVRVHPAGADPITVTGSPVARDLPISPIALGDETVVDTETLSVPAGSEWTVDFAKAKDAGMGVEVRLPAGIRVIEKIVVVGIRQSASEADSAAELASLLTSHRYTDGVSFPAAGTPTNNADAARSPYRREATASAPPLVPRAASADASALAPLLGLDPVAVESLLEPDAGSSSLGAAQRAANTALWYATWDPVLQRIDDVDVPAVTPATIESARQVHRDDVRGAGHAPVLRIGAQPYGVLPVTDLAAWRPRRGELTAALAPLITRTLARWVARSGTLPRVRPGDDVSDDDLLDMLGTSPVSTGVRARPAVDGPNVSTLAAATGGDQGRVTAEQHLSLAILSQYSADIARLLLPPALHDESRRLALPLVSERDTEVIAAILDGGSPQIDSVLQALLDVAWDQTENRLAVTPGKYVPPIIDVLSIPPDLRAIVTSVTTDKRIPVGELPAPQELRVAAETLRSTVHFDGQPTDQLSIAAIEPVAEARTSLAQVALDLGDSPQAKWIGQNAIAGLLDAFAVRGEVAEAMQLLAGIPIDERRIATASALDIASHRVDAWATGLAASRVRPDPAGLTLGAYGYVEDVRLGAAGAEPQGWLHAPSSSHAVAAGILASAHRSRIGAKAGTQPFAIDLTSRRGTELRRVLEGVHAGQSIGALLGYQIERALTSSAARFQLSLRELAPLVTDELDNDLAEADRTARVAAANVVDGVALLRQFPVASLDAADPPLRTALTAKPENPFIETWDPISPEEWAAVVAALKGAASTLDAVSDALLSESVLQYVGGNAARASAAMDAMGTGAAVDPELGVLGVRQSGRNLTHAVFAAIGREATGWSQTRPRAIAEPRLEAWAARRLGDPALIVIADDGGTRHTVADAGFAALDLVFADDLAGLARDLRAALPALGELPLADAAAAGWPDGAVSITAAATLAGTLRSIVAGAAPVLPEALVRPGAAAQRTLDTDDLLARCDALLDALEKVLTDGSAAVALIDPDSRSVEEDEVDDVTAAVAGLAAFGVPLVPDPEVPSSMGWAWGAWQAASARLAHARAGLADIRAPHDPPRTPAEMLDAATAVAEGILGDGFRLLPLLVPVAPADPAEGDAFAQAVSSPLFDPPSNAALNAFVRDHASVRAGVGRLSEAQLIGGALGTPIGLAVVQLTERDGSEPAPGTARWLAGPLPDDTPWPAHTAAHLVVEFVDGEAAVAGPFAGLSIDGWTEALPFQPDPGAFAEGAVDTPLRAARATTGLAVQARQASARAPQAILSVVSPDGQRWKTDSVVRSVLAAIDVAKARMVTYESVPGDAAILPAIYVASPWLQPRKGLVFDKLAQVSWATVANPFLSEVK